MFTNLARARRTLETVARPAGAGQASLVPEACRNVDGETGTDSTIGSAVGGVFMKTLVIGGTGTVGGRVLSGLIEKGVDVRALTHSPEKAKTFPQGVEAVVGDLTEPDSLSRAFAGAGAVFFVTPLAETETQQGLNAVEAARKAKTRKIVYSSVALPKGSEHIPHFASKIPIEEAVRSSGADWTILRPNSFFQNDYWYQEPITKHGIYPQPIGSAGMNRVDVRDIADAAVNSLLNPGHAGQTYLLHGPDAVTGESTAQTWSRHLGRDVRYAGDDLDAWEKQHLQFLPAWLVPDLRIMYDYFQKNGFRPTAGDLEHEAKAVGHPPRRFDDFARETAASWKKG